MITSEISLRPHQQNLIKQVLDGDRLGPTYLAAPWGMGKSTALGALAAEALKRNPQARILFLGSFSALVAQFSMRLAATVPAISVDRYTFRAMSDYRETSAIWDEPRVYVLTLQFARQPDIRASLLATRWDLLICDEIGETVENSSNARLIDELADVSDRAIIAGRQPFAAAHLKTSATVIQWDKSTAIDADGRSVSPPDPIRVSVAYPMAAELNQLRERILLLDQSKLEGEDGDLADALESSPAAAEMLALGLQNRSADNGRETTHGQAASMVLRTIETLHSDEKVSALIKFVSGLRLAESGVRICVVTRFVQTAYYLASALAEVAQTELVTASQETAHPNFINQDGTEPILVGTPMKLSLRDDLREIDFLIFYDGGSSAAALQLIEAANPLGRAPPLTIASLQPSVGDASGPQ